MNSMFNAFMSITIWSSIIIAALMIIRRLFSQKLSAKFFKLAWLCLAIRLVLPFDISLPTAPITVEVPPVLYLESNAPIINTQGNIVDTPLFADDAPPLPVSTASLALALVKKLLPAIWLIGAGLYFGTGLISYLIFAARLRRSRQAAGSQLTTPCRRVAIYSSPLVSSPILCGFAFPAIYVPCKAYSQQESESIISHEILHYRQGDLWLQLLLLGAVSLSWFNPFVHHMRRKAICDIEMAVDEMLLAKATKEQRLEYGNMLFTEISSREGLLLAQYNSSSTIKERFAAILSTATKSRGRVLLCALLAICVGVSLLVSCTPQQTPPSSTPAISVPPVASESQSETSSSPQSQAVSSSSSSIAEGGFSAPLKDCTNIRGKGNGHRGYDFAAPEDTPIYAVLDGEIIIAMSNPADDQFGNLGYYIKIDHGNGLESIYAHCSELLVTEGTVKAGDKIALVGSTGNSSGNHLHFEITSMENEALLKELPEQAATQLKEFFYSLDASNEYSKWVESSSSAILPIK